MYPYWRRQLRSGEDSPGEAWSARVGDGEFSERRHKNSPVRARLPELPRESPCGLGKAHAGGDTNVVCGSGLSMRRSWPIAALPRPPAHGSAWVSGGRPPGSVVDDQSPVAHRTLTGRVVLSKGIMERAEPRCGWPVPLPRSLHHTAGCYPPNSPMSFRAPSAPSKPGSRSSARFKDIDAPSLRPCL